MGELDLGVAQLVACAALVVGCSSATVVPASQGGAPRPAVAASPGATALAIPAACDALARQLDVLAACASVPEPLRQDFAESARSARRNYTIVNRTRDVVIQLSIHCDRLHPVFHDEATRYGCSSRSENEAPRGDVRNPFDAPAEPARTRDDMRRDDLSRPSDSRE